jgi:hypothetical protein
MFIDLFTTPEEILADLSEKLTNSEVKMLAERIEEFGEKQILRNMVRNVPEGKIAHMHLVGPDIELINKLADYLPPKEKMRLMKLKYEDLAQLQKESLNEYYDLIKKVVANKYKDRYEGYEVTTEVFLEYIGSQGINYSKKNFLAYISKRSFPFKYLEIMKYVIENELIEIEDF